jgi:hypothetical protein
MSAEAISRHVRRRAARLSGVFLAALVLQAPTAGAADWASRPTRIGGLTVLARATPTGVQLPRGGGLFAAKFWSGVNLGTTLPGHDPGELAIPRSEYDRWLVEMGAVGVRSRSSCRSTGGGCGATRSLPRSTTA